TRPSIISGKPVAWLTSVTSSPASRRARAVPPVDSNCTPRAARARPSSINPLLSETESSARYTRTKSCAIGSVDPVIAQLLAQGSAVDAQHCRGAALVAFAVVQHFGEQRDLELAQRDLVQIVGVTTVEVAQVAAHRVGDMVAQRRARSAA